MTPESPNLTAAPLNLGSANRMAKLELKLDISAFSVASAALKDRAFTFF